jgi:hypothetical protein
VPNLGERGDDNGLMLAMVDLEFCLVFGSSPPPYLFFYTPSKLQINHRQHKAIIITSFS